MSGIPPCKTNYFEAASGPQSGTVDEFVAMKAPKIYRVQQLSLGWVFAMLNLKDFQEGKSGGAPGPEPDPSNY